MHFSSMSSRATWPSSGVTEGSGELMSTSDPLVLVQTAGFAFPGPQKQHAT